MSKPSSPVLDPTARPAWRPTGYKFFPYAARHCGQWWVLRRNYGFPDHDMYTVFIDGRAAADVTGNDRCPLAASIEALQPFAQSGEALLAIQVAEPVVGAVARYVVYGSETDEPCPSCAHLGDQDPLMGL